MSKWLLGVAAAAALGLSGCESLHGMMGMGAAAPTATSDYIVAAVNDPSRPQADKDKDASRHPAELMAFARITPGAQVSDIWTGSGYWSRLFGKAVGPSGRVMAVVPAEIAGFKNKPVDVAKAMAAEPGRGNLQAFSAPMGMTPLPEHQNTTDVVFIFENYHDLHDSFMKEADGTLLDVDAYNRAMFSILKPGGYFVIVDHAAPAGSGLKNTEDLHRIDPAALRAEVEKAGFVFDGKSRVLANPADPHTVGVFDKALRGNTDRFAYRFRKPK